jgi:murein DD-endopeptidase MepM/ murein hydrolase activator NlpD
VYGIAPIWRLVRRVSLRGIVTLGLLCAIAVFVASPVSISAEESAELVGRPLAPTLAGAPFLPSTERTSSVTERADLLLRRDHLELATRALRSRPHVAETLRIIESQDAAVSRRLATLQTDDLQSKTAAFGIGVGVFPVDELRKPFHDDWDDPRSGGRRHRGTDLLAQTGVGLRAIEDGVFEQTSTGSLGGLSVYLIGDSGARYYYAHMDQVELLIDGQRVYAGQVIGTIGDSGNAKGSPHLHLQWAPDGETGWENPFPLLDSLYGEGSFTPANTFGPPNAQR